MGILLAPRRTEYPIAMKIEMHVSFRVKIAMAMVMIPSGQAEMIVLTMMRTDFPEM